MRAEILIFDGFDELDALGPFEVLANAVKVAGGPGDAVRLVALGGPRLVAGSHGARVEAPAAPGEDATLLVVPGGGWNDRSPAGARAEAQHGEVPGLIATAHARGMTIASVCTGGMLVAATGLLEGRPAITHHAAVDDLAAAGVQVVHARVVDDGELVSAGGVTSGLDLALHLVRREFGAGVADLVAREMEHDWAGVAVHHGPRGDS